MTDQTLKRSWLVQRLSRPHMREGVFDVLLSGMAFGGGLRNGGLSTEAMGLLSKVFRFEYMGSAEFEFGKLPEALQRIARSSENPGLVGRSFEIEFSEIAPNTTVPPKNSESKKLDGTATVWFLCPKGWEDEVVERVSTWAGKLWNSDLKENTRLASTLCPLRDFELEDKALGMETCGWIELDNGFMFFTDEKMWRTTCQLFGAEVPE